MRSDDTIFAIASGHGRAAVCLIRISGPGSGLILERMAGGVPEPRRAVVRTLVDPATGEPLDQALVLWMPGPRSFTGEDQAELHIHGGLATRAAVLRALGSLEGCRPAQAGEFTRRAFLNGRMDLSQVEGLADIIDAETEAQRRQAMRQLGGRLGNAAEGWRERVLQALALLEASLDFSDEGDVPEGLEAEILRLTGEVEGEIAGALATRSGERLREGLTVVLAGPPNAGKSTLLNALARRDVAIVSPIAGTTRDAIEVHCDLGGLPVVIVDTAGLRESADLIEQEGVSRARTRAQDADLVLWLVPPEGEASPPPPARRLLKLGTKADLNRNRPDCDLLISASTGEGMPELVSRLEAEAASLMGQGDAVITRERHRLALGRAQESLQRARAMLTGKGPLELTAEEVRLAARAIGEITGRVDVEDVLDRLFSSFCIGK
ncbi:tRNA uridine-5-carboxymethylaminomethyl(34) synthesis GTPase MnmE [Microvirga arsenatis]|uniref:tRNA modification GTPase MnmE n=1 Tax=Microvirga arsenatis TaxID=2692265 RepID=A0ABW9YZT9_9HYPH|nr:tRNA uridine-5-carboxymethylaminomethyl(34) synthesis GTPase MnmE [Microvirga arsenatis]NBJ12941.1 tRNA uridine-5-carboxymethylaminomethyl(34) synthesis GTPase MnmE [Microvirga arsenatis]NBJ23929.1 tRNA uridine-5-carboxymethylaminomethyl(34) synthesis GTPase MnmE [Microvirga arsenatis]